MAVGLADAEAGARHSRHCAESGAALLRPVRERAWFAVEMAAVMRRVSDCIDRVTRQATATLLVLASTALAVLAQFLALLLLLPRLGPGERRLRQQRAGQASGRCAEPTPRPGIESRAVHTDLLWRVGESSAKAHGTPGRNHMFPWLPSYRTVAIMQPQMRAESAATRRSAVSIHSRTWRAMRSS